MGVLLCFRGDGHGGDVSLPERARCVLGEEGLGGEFRETQGAENSLPTTGCYPDWDFCCC